jgi:hypothetical protein
MNTKFKFYFFAIMLALSNALFVSQASAYDCYNQTGIHIGPNQSLYRGQSIGGGGMTIAHQTDGNVVAYYNGRAVWHTATGGRATTRLTMQTDGNLVLYGPSGAIWASYTFGSQYRYFRMYYYPGCGPVVLGIGNFYGTDNVFYAHKVLGSTYQ